jgi:hypothetical protein
MKFLVVVDSGGVLEVNTVEGCRVYKKRQSGDSLDCSRRFLYGLND